VIITHPKMKPPCHSAVLSLPVSVGPAPEEIAYGSIRYHLFRWLRSTRGFFWCPAASTEFSFQLCWSCNSPSWCSWRWCSDGTPRWANSYTEQGAWGWFL